MDFGVIKIIEYMLINEQSINVIDISKKIIRAQNIKFSDDSLVCNKDWVDTVLLPKIKKDNRFRDLEKHVKDTLLNIFTSDILEKYTIFTIHAFPLNSELPNMIRIVDDNYKLTITYRKEISCCIFDIELGRFTFNIKIETNEGNCEANDIGFLLFDPDNFDFIRL